MTQILKNAKSWLPGLIISTVCVILILYFVDLGKFVEAVRTADPFWLVLSVLMAVLWLAVRGVVWRALLRENASYRDVFLTLNEGYLLNNFLPLRLGELGRAFLLSRKSGLGFMQVLPTIVLERVLDLAFSALILIAAVPFVVGASGADRVAYAIGALVVAGLFALYLLARNHDWALGVFDKLSLRWPVLQRFGGDLLKSFFEGLAILTDGRLFLRVLLLMTVNWIIAIAQFWVILLAFFPQASAVWAMFGLGAAAFGGAIPALPGGVGTFEAVMAAALTLITADPARSLAAAIVAHLLNYLITGVFGIYALSTEGQTLSGVYQQLVKFRQSGQTDQ